MSREEDRLLRDRALRNRARAVLDEQLSRVKEDLEARGVGARAAQTVTDEARQVADAGASLARESKGIIAGALGALLVWQFRGPLLRQIKDVFARFSIGNDEAVSEDGEPDGE